MEILKRAKGVNDGEIVSFRESSEAVMEEALRRSAKTGYSTRLGEPTYGTKVISTVGFGKQKLNVWPRDKDGHLIGD